MSDRLAGKPIKDRGIRWQESYGDKSSYLKNEFESQIGPGSYFRWEGHDSTTGNDYYVVVSPGYSKKHGYHFFAGLRKMPADQGASGKKFKTQREALSYAFEHWRVPNPEIRPAKAYQVNDLVGKDIVTESTHDAATEGFMIKEAMSLQGSGAIDTEWSRRVGPKVLTDMCCFAYKASSSMGFLAALYSRLRMSGVDKMNAPVAGSQKGHDEFTGKGDSVLPPAPAVATCDSPPQATFDQIIHAQGVPVSNPLMGFSKGKGKDAVYSEPFHPAPNEDGYQQKRWRDARIEPKVSFASPPDPAWLESLNAAGISHAAPKPRKGQSVRARQEYSFEVPAASYGEFLKSVADAKGQVMGIGNHEQRNLVALMDLRKAQGKDISEDLDKPYFETIWLKGSQLMAYDEEGMPLGLQGKYQPRSGSETDNTTGGGGTEVKYVLRDPNALVDAWADPELARLVADRDNPKFDPTAKAAKAQKVADMVAQIKSGQRKVQAGSFSNAPAEQRSSLLAAFKELAAANAVPVSHDIVADARTCCPHIGNTKTIVPAVDRLLLPVNSKTKHLSSMDEMLDGFHNFKMPYCPDYTINAPMQKHGGGEVPAARRFDPVRNTWVYGPLPEGAQASQAFNGTRVVSSTSMHVAKPKGGLHSVAGGEWTRYNPNSKGSFIPGPLMDVGMAPEFASTKGTDKNMVGQGQGRRGWVLFSQEHPLMSDGGKVVPRQHASKPLTDKDPESPDSAAFYTVDLGGGKTEDLRKYVYKEGGKVYFRDNWAALQLMKKMTGLKDKDVGPVTRVTDTDLRVIDDQVADATKYYEKWKDVPEESRSAEFDERKFRFGSTASKCGGENPPPEVMEAFAEAMENPEQAFKPKLGTLWGIKISKADGTEEWLRDEDQDKDVVVFGAKSAAEAGLSLAAVKNAVADGGKADAAEYQKDAILVPSYAKRLQQDPNAELTKYSKHMVAGIMGYNKAVQQQPQDMGEDEEEDMEPEEQPAPGLEGDSAEQPQAQDEAQPQAQVEAPPVPAPLSEQAPQQPQAVAPKRKDVELVPLPEYKPKPKPVPTPPGPQKPVAATSKMVAMARRLYAEGDTQEAESIKQIVLWLEGR